MRSMRMIGLVVLSTLVVAASAGVGPLASETAAAPLARPHVSGQLRYPIEGVSGPISVTASADTAACLGGEVTLSVSVRDAIDNGVSGAAVAGTLQYGSIARSFAFPPTDASGNTSTRVDTTRPDGIRDVYFTVDATAGSNTGEAQTSC